MSETNENKLKNAFVKSLEVAENQITDELAYNSIKAWDSTAHMILIAELEDVFEIMLDTDDIIDMSSYAKAREILQKYEVVF